MPVAMFWTLRSAWEAAERSGALNGHVIPRRDHCSADGTLASLISTLNNNLALIPSTAKPDYSQTVCLRLRGAFDLFEELIIIAEYGSARLLFSRSYTTYDWNDQDCAWLQGR